MFFFWFQIIIYENKLNCIHYIDLNHDTDILCVFKNICMLFYLHNY